VEVFELTGVTSFRRRLQATAARGLTRFIGRQPELEALGQALERAGRGQGQLVAVVGEPGVGKSRLVYEFLHSHRTQGWRVLESASVSYGRATLYFPVIDLLKRYTHVEEPDDPRTIRAKVTGQVLTLDEALQETVPALLALLDALPADSPFLQLDPSQRRQRTLMALKRVLLRESHVQALLLVFEDLHWIDSETQALLDSLVDSLPTARLLLLVNYRPEYQHGWGAKTYYTQVRLDPLPLRSSEELLDVLLGSEPGLVPLKHLLIARTEGNPFFLEESVRALVEMGVLGGERGAYRLDTPLQSIQVPATVQAVLAARIDRLLPEEKRLLQTAAVVGNEVPLPLLQNVAELPEDALHRGLTHLQAVEFLYETRLFPEQEYTFKHALTHEVAYGSLLQERRQRLHAQIAEALEKLSDDRLTEQVERLAHHAFRGAIWDKALVYCRQAGAKAMVHSAHHQAVTYWEQALEALKHLPSTRALREQAIDLRFSVRNALNFLGDYDRCFTYLREAEALAEGLGDQRRLGRVYAHLTIHFANTGHYDTGIEYGQRALSLATTLGDLALQVSARYLLGVAYYEVGEYHRAIDLLKCNVTALEGSLRYERLLSTGLPLANASAFLAACLAEVGAFADARIHGHDAIQLAETDQPPITLIRASFGAGYLHIRQGDFDHAIPVLERGLACCQAGEVPMWLPTIATTLGTAYALTGRIATAVPLLEDAVAEFTSMRLLGLRAYPMLALSEAYLLAERLEEATSRAQQTLAHVRQHKKRGLEAYALRLLGDIATHGSPPENEQAEAHYQQALALAEELGMRPLQAHCHLGLGTLYGKVGRQDQARTELSTAIELYRSMEMIFWLPQAEAALAQVEGH
jgi:tetratricopeptide (TPR) repeat protein